MVWKQCSILIQWNFRTARRPTYYLCIIETNDFEGAQRMILTNETVHVKLSITLSQLFTSCNFLSTCILFNFLAITHANSVMTWMAIDEQGCQIVCIVWNNLIYKCLFNTAMSRNLTSRRTRHGLAL